VTLNASGFFGGGQVGYNWQVGQLVLGLEGDMSGSAIEAKLGADATASGIGSLSASAGTKLDWFGTVRGRLGYVIRPDIMIYGTGGWAFGHTTSTATVTLTPGGTFSASASNDKSGWAAGAGIEYAIAPFMTFKTEYLYVDLGTDQLFSTTIFGAPVSVSEQTRIHTIKAGLNFKFGGLGGWL
jgi:outer membrane immunogenic protein